MGCHGDIAHVNFGNIGGGKPQWQHWRVTRSLQEGDDDLGEGGNEPRGATVT